MSSWKVGDIAIIDTEGPIGDGANINGQQVQLLRFMSVNPNHRLSQHSDWWDVRSDSKDVYSREVCFRKPYDGNELCKWEDMKDIFIPRELVVTT